MTTEGIGTLLAIVRRSWLIIVVLLVLGIVQMNLIRRADGPLYAAHAEVVLSPTDLASELAGVSSYVDPNLVDQTEQALASSPQLFAYAAQHHGRGESAAQLSVTTASKNGSTISFGASASSPAQAIAIVNAVATAYPAWRASVTSASIDQAIAQLRAQVAHSATKNPDVVAQLDKLRLLKTITSGNVLLVEPADSAVKTRPRLALDSLLGAFIGLFIALIVIAIREALDSRVRGEKEAEGLLDVPVLGTVEKLPRKSTALVSGPEAHRFGDMYALLAATVAQREVDGQALRIAVTSATPGEGKTTTSINLAAALARRNAHVVLLDFDTRRPAIARSLRVPSGTPGAEEALDNPNALGTLLWDVSLNGTGPSVSRSELVVGPDRAGEGRLEVLPMRSSVIDSLAGRGEQLEQLLAAVAARADYIVIDTPPALSTPDVTELVEKIDLLLVVVRHGVVSRRNLQAMQRLQRTWRSHAEVQAVVVGVPADVQTYAYYSTA